MEKGCPPPLQRTCPLLMKLIFYVPLEYKNVLHFITDFLLHAIKNCAIFSSKDNLNIHYIHGIILFTEYIFYIYQYNFILGLSKNFRFNILYYVKQMLYQINFVGLRLLRRAKICLGLVQDTSLFLWVSIKFFSKGKNQPDHQSPPSSLLDPWIFLFTKKVVYGQKKNF